MELKLNHETIQMKSLPDREFAFIYVHKTNGAIRVESLKTAKRIDVDFDYNHVATIDPLACLESILRASIKDRNLIIKRLIT